MACGPGRILPDFTRSQISVQVGDRVVFDALTGIEIQTQGGYTVISDKSILAVVLPEEA